MTKYLKEEEVKDSTLLEVSGALKEGKIVVFKTDTVYGMGTNAFDGDACEKVYEIKGRPKQKPLCLLISDISMLDTLVERVSPAEKRLMDTFWPGPLTIKFRKKEGILPDIVSTGDEFVRIRLLSEGLAFELIQAAGVPVVAPSANLSGNPTGIHVLSICEELDDKVDYILDSGDVCADTPSTIVEIVDEQAIVIREGIIKKDEIAKVVELAD